MLEPVRCNAQNEGTRGALCNMQVWFAVQCTMHAGWPQCGSTRTEVMTTGVAGQGCRGILMLERLMLAVDS